jgi:hypothetical protein
MAFGSPLVCVIGVDVSQPGYVSRSGLNHLLGRLFRHKLVAFGDRYRGCLAFQMLEKHEHCVVFGVEAVSLQDRPELEVFILKMAQQVVPPLFGALNSREQVCGVRG